MARRRGRVLGKGNGKWKWKWKVCYNRSWERLDLRGAEYLYVKREKASMFLFKEPTNEAILLKKKMGCPTSPLLLFKFALT